MITQNDGRTTQSLTRKMTLQSLLDQYLAAVACSPKYAESLRRTVRKAEGSGMVYVCQLAPDSANKMLAGLRLSPTTVSNIRRELLTLWRYAHEEGLTDIFPHRVRKVRQAAYVPVCWTQDVLEKMWAAAAQDQTPISSRVALRRCNILPAWIGVGYDTAMRFSDVHSLRLNQIRERCVVGVAGKTGKAIVRQLSAATLGEVASLARRSPDGTLFLWALPRRRALKMWRDFLDENDFGGSSKWLRRCAATAVEARERGAATAFLQHSHPSLAYRHYIDGTQVGVPQAPPPIRTHAYHCAASDP